MTTYLLRHDDERGYTLIQSEKGSVRVIGFVEKLRANDWILAGWWAPADPKEYLHDHDAPMALLAGCARAGIDVAALEPKDQESVLLRADAIGYQRMQKYDPNAAIAANE